MSRRDNRKPPPGLAYVDDGRDPFSFVKKPSDVDHSREASPRVQRPAASSRQRRSQSLYDPSRLQLQQQDQSHHESRPTVQSDSHPAPAGQQPPRHMRNASESLINSSTRHDLNARHLMPPPQFVPHQVENIQPEHLSTGLSERQLGKQPASFPTDTPSTNLDAQWSGPSDAQDTASQWIAQISEELKRQYDYVQRAGDAKRQYDAGQGPEWTTGPITRWAPGTQAIWVTKSTPAQTTTSPGLQSGMTQHSTQPLGSLFLDEDDGDDDAMDYDLTDNLATPGPDTQSELQIAEPDEDTSTIGNGFEARLGRRRLGSEEINALFGTPPQDRELCDNEPDEEEIETGTGASPEVRSAISTPAPKPVNVKATRPRQRSVRSRLGNQRAIESPETRPPRRIIVSESGSDSEAEHEQVPMSEASPEPSQEVVRRKKNPKKPRLANGEEDLTGLKVKPLEPRTRGKGRFHSKIDTPPTLNIAPHESELNAFKALVFRVFCRALFPKNTQHTISGDINEGRKLVIIRIINGIRALYGPNFQAIVDEWRAEFREEMRRMRIHFLAPIKHEMGDNVLCSCCKQRHGVASSVRFFGVPCKNHQDGNVDIALDESDQDVDPDFKSGNDPARFYVGDKCIDIIRIHHSLKHWERHLKRWIMQSLQDCEFIDADGLSLLTHGLRITPRRIHEFGALHFDGWYDSAKEGLEARFEELCALLRESQNFRSENFGDDQKHNPIFNIKPKPTKRDRAFIRQNSPVSRPEAHGNGGNTRKNGPGVAVKKDAVDLTRDERPDTPEAPVPESSRAPALRPSAVPEPVPTTEEEKKKLLNEDIYFLSDGEQREEVEYELAEDEQPGRRRKRL